MPSVVTMATAAPQPTKRETPKLPDVQQLQDTLYEILTTGLDPEESRVPLAKVEKFLHEHARQPKSREEFVAFYETCSLALPVAGGPWSDTMASEIRIVPLPPVREPELRPLSLDVVRELGDDATDPHMVLLEDDPTPRARASARTPMFALWGALATVTMLFLGTLWWGHGIVDAMRGQLQAAQLRGDENRRVIRQLEDRAHQIEGRTADIQSSVAASGEMIQQMDQKSDLLLQFITEPESKKRK